LFILVWVQLFSNRGPITTLQTLFPTLGQNAFFNGRQETLLRLEPSVVRERRLNENQLLEVRQDQRQGSRTDQRITVGSRI
jgi:hypothetical protein